MWHSEIPPVVFLPIMDRNNSLIKREKQVPLPLQVQRAPAHVLGLLTSLLPGHSSLVSVFAVDVRHTLTFGQIYLIIIVYFFANRNIQLK